MSVTFKKWKSLVENEIGKWLKCHNLIMEANTAIISFIVTVHTMGFVETRQLQEHHKKMVCENG